MKNYLLVLFIVSLLFSCGKQAEIAQWRGLNRDGVYNEKGLLKSWPEDGPDLLWVYEECGDGYGSVSALNDKLFFNGVIDSISYLIALGSDGELLWKSPNGPGFTGDGFSASFPGSRSTPTVINDLVYSLSGLGRIGCFDVKTGIEKWAVDMQKDLNGIMDYFGYGESLLIDDEKLFCFPGGKDTNMVALERFTGEIIWVSKALSDSVSHCSPIIIKMPAKNVLLNFSIRNFMGLDADTGELLWSHEQEKRKYSEQSNTPIFYNDYLYYLAGDGNGAVKLKILDNGNSFKEIWRNHFGRNSFNNFVIRNDKLYSTNDKFKLKALDINTGEVTDSIRVKSGSVITADDMLYCYSDNGLVSLIDISGQKLEIVSQFKVEQGSREHFSTPSINNGVMYIRHGNALMAYDIKNTK